MTEQQKLDLIRQVLQAVGMVMTLLGFASADVVATWVNTAMQVAGPILSIGTIIWGFFTNRASAVISQVANMDEVKKIQLEPNVPQDIAAATPSNVSK